MIATGQIGNDPVVRVWDAETKETLSVIQGLHTVGVCAVDFSASGKLLLTVGLEESHSIGIWKWTDGEKTVFFFKFVSLLFSAIFLC